MPVTGAVIVTTPQDIALLDARKGLKMFEKVGVPVLGIVENMSIHVCSNCGHAEHIFGAGGGERMARAVRRAAARRAAARHRASASRPTRGTPTVVAEPDGADAREAYLRDGARARPARSRDAAEGPQPAMFPKIVGRDS